MPPVGNVDMFRLTRQVRFSINPFGPFSQEGANSYASVPSGEGLCLFLALTIEVAGPLDPDTGFVVNVMEIDRQAREHTVPLLAEHIRRRFRDGQAVSLSDLVGLLHEARQALEGRLATARVGCLYLALNPYRTLAIWPEDTTVMLFSEKFEFAATHTLWNSRFGPEENAEMFGKCANPTGHGHNYVLEVKVRCPVAREDWRIARFQQIVEEAFLSRVDHKNLNLDVPQFAEAIPSVENLAVMAWRCLQGRLDPAKLEEVAIWETDKTCCIYRPESADGGTPDNAS